MDENLILEGLDEENNLQTVSLIMDKNMVQFPKDDLEFDQTGIKRISTGKNWSGLFQYMYNQDIEFGKIIGKGASSVVQEGVLKLPQQNIKIAIKKISIYEKSKRHQMLNDLKVLLTGYQCENLIKCFGAYYEQGQIHIILEMMDFGSLRDFINITNKINQNTCLIPEKILASIIKQVLKGVEFLHIQKKQLHRDIKPENILISSNGLVKLTDFGISKQLDNSQNNICQTFVGTSNYMSPERMQGKDYSFVSDNWSIGLVCCELATGKFPYPQKTNNLINFFLNVINSEEPNLPKDSPYSNLLRDFINKSLCKDQQKRASITELMQHNWIKQYASEPQELAQYLLQLSKQHSEMFKYEQDIEQMNNSQQINIKNNSQVNQGLNSVTQVNLINSNYNQLGFQQQQLQPQFNLPNESNNYMKDPGQDKSKIELE